MESVPKLPMLSFELRINLETVDFSVKLKQYIRNYYNEDPMLYAAAFTGVNSLRREAVNPSRSIDGVKSLKRYYSQILRMSHRFPMKENEEASIPFSWKNLHSNSTTKLSDISLELASILHNIGALYTQLGAMENRLTDEGLRVSCTHFQCALWAFQQLKEQKFSKELGLSPVLISFMCHLCLAQAQECIVEKSMMDNRKPGITVKIVVQLVDLYKESLARLVEWPQREKVPADITSLKVYKNFHKYVLFKIAYYESISLLFQGLHSENQQKMGERISFFKAASEQLETARKLNSGLDNSENITEALTIVNDVIEKKKKAAVNENEFIYHEDVPNIAHLPKVEGSCLVKEIPFDINDPEVSGPDLFSNIVPMKAHESASLYSEEKAKLLRRINNLIENKDEELETFLSMLDLDEFRSKADGSKVPQELIDRCAFFNAKPDAIKNLTEAMSKLSDVFHDVGSMLAEIKEILQKEENQERDYQQMLGKRPPSIAATDLTREAKKYQEAHAKASESNQTLHKAMIMHIPNLKLLCLPLKELLNHLPAVTESAEVEAITKEMLHLMSKVEEMKKQRLKLATQMRDLAQQDDITRQVITYSGDKINDLFQQELKKYDNYVSLIEQNLLAQDNILRALKDCYARYGSTRKTTGELNKRRTAMISSLMASFDAYEDLLSKSSKGLDFYKKLETNVSKLLQRVKGTCKVQDEEREQMLKSVTKSELNAGNISNSSQPEVPSTMKLKDYLNIKKETGKLSLDQPTIPPTTAFYSDSASTQQNWIPGIRPAPVGSEQADTTFKPSSDSLHGFYQTDGKDQSTTVYGGISQNSSYPVNQDMYPISSYSSVLPKVEGQGGYEPKSNYYDIGSPNRYYHPNSSYSEGAGNLVSANSIRAYPPASVNFPQVSDPKVLDRNSSDVPNYVNYSSQNMGSFQPYSNFTPQPEMGSSIRSFENDPQLHSTYNNSVYLHSQHTFGSSDRSQVPYSSNVFPASQVQPSTVYNTYPDQSLGIYDSVISSRANIHSYSNNFQAPLPDSGASSFPTHEVIYPNSQIYVTQKSSFTVENENNVALGLQPPLTYSVAPGGSYVPSQSVETSTQYVQDPNTSQSTWSGTYSQTPQFMQSGNESLYAASQTPTHYTITSSDFYKPDIQEATYLNFGSQYYNNQYGAYGGQADINSQNGTPLTYMQAGTDKQQAVTTTTFSNSEAKASPTTNPSYVDLLADLDFNINHSPLVPETTPAVAKDKTSTEAPAKPKAANKVEPVEKINLSKESLPEKAALEETGLTGDRLAQFALEVEKYEKFVEGLTLKTLNGPTGLDLKWKEITDSQEKISPQLIISVARCYPMKNRFPDILPYDNSRVELPSTKDDYINASRMMSLTKLTPPFILTQAPLPSTYADFWAMVFEQQVEVVVCLLSDSELDANLYWPSEKGQELELKNLKISLQSSNAKPFWVERILSVCQTETRVTRVVVHLQFTAWPGSSFPDTPASFLSFSSECLNFFTQQRSYNHPVVVHCISGVGRTGLFCLIIASILDIKAGNGIPDLAVLAERMCRFRKSCLRDREHLRFAYQAVLYYSQDLLVKHGISTNLPAYTNNKSSEGKCPANDLSLESSSNSENELKQMQVKMKDLGIDSNVNEGSLNSKNKCSTEQSSGTSSPISSVTALDSTNFTLNNTDSCNQKKKRYTPENFNKNSTMEASNQSNDDPLSQLDPLWTMKK